MNDYMYVKSVSVAHRPSRYRSIVVQGWTLHISVQKLNLWKLVKPPCGSDNHLDKPSILIDPKISDIIAPL